MGGWEQTRNKTLFLNQNLTKASSPYASLPLSLVTHAQILFTTPDKKSTFIMHINRHQFKAAPICISNKGTSIVSLKYCMNPNIGWSLLTNAIQTLTPRGLYFLALSLGWLRMKRLYGREVKSLPSLVPFHDKVLMEHIGTSSILYPVSTFLFLLQIISTNISWWNQWQRANTAKLWL